MSKVRGILATVSGTIGDVTFARRKNSTVAYQKAEKSTSKSKNAVLQRMRWMNPLNVFKAFWGRLQNAFEMKETKQTTFATLS